nr:LysM peptidoglycan-binding domain-containing protein [Virgibacillus pantothenticus]
MKGVSKPSKGKGIHTVKKGDILWDIAKDHGITVKQLKNLNNLSSDLIHPRRKRSWKKPSKPNL